jgi:hypothetical protein
VNYQGVMLNPGPAAGGLRRFLSPVLIHVKINTGQCQAGLISGLSIVMLQYTASVGLIRPFISYFLISAIFLQFLIRSLQFF